MGEILEFGAVVTIVMGGVLAWRFCGVWIRRLERRPKATAGELEEVGRRLHALEEQAEHHRTETEGRLMEVEERLDFAERLLRQHRDRSARPPHE